MDILANKNMLSDPSEGMDENYGYCNKYSKNMIKGVKDG